MSPKYSKQIVEKRKAEDTYEESSVENRDESDVIMPTIRLPNFSKINMTPTIGTSKQGMELEKKGDAGYLSNSAARLMAAEVFKLNNSEDGKDLSSDLRDCRGVNRMGTENTEKSFFRRKIAAHIIKKAEKERDAAQREKLAKIGEPLSSDIVRINNNLSLQISRHTSRHSRYEDDESTESDDDDADSFCDEDEPIIVQDVQMENSLNLG